MKAKPAKETVPRHPRPVTLDDYRRYSAGVYQANNWDADEQLRHRRELGIADAATEHLPIDDLRIVLDDFERNHMILYRS